MEIISCMNSIRKKSSKACGYSLLELMMVLAVFSTVAAGGILTVTNVIRAGENTKLKRDVAVINRAIRTYLVNGGTFHTADLRSPATVLSKLKTRASADSAKQLAGMRHAMTDERLNFEMQSNDEGLSDTERARFIPDPTNPRFAIETGGVPGIRRFYLDANLAGQDFGTEERSGTMKLAKTEPWVWDYTDTPNRRAAPGSTPTPTFSTANIGATAPSNTPLNPPNFSLPSGSDTYVSYPKTLTLLPTNPSGTAAISYSINSGPFIPYGGPISVAPNSSVTAISVTLDPDRYDDSASSSRNYASTAIPLVAEMAFTKTAYTYFELGGKADPATPPPPPAQPVLGTGLVTNLSVLPVVFQNSTVFRYVWTTDGSNPLTSGTAQTQADFTGGFVPPPLSVTPSAFGSATSVTVKGAAKSQDAAVVINSAVVTQTLNAAAVPLRSPLVTIDGRDVTLSVDVSGRDMPENARIYYTTDGTDPGVDSAGNPLHGTLFTGDPFTLEGSTGGTLKVVSRTYPPLGYPQFFTTSAPTTTTLVLPAITDVYVGGIFVNSSGQPMRNIAKLGNSGKLDHRFNTGTGASVDSIVGVVRQGTGGVLAGGDFISMNGVARSGAVLLTPTGGVDSSFDAALTSN